jgi:type IX secretion system substrate protein
MPATSANNLYCIFTHQRTIIKQMKRLLLCFFLIQVFAIGLSAQASLSITPGTFSLTGHPSNNDVNIHIEVKNNSNFDAFVLWSREVESPPQGWLTWICDKNLCYLPIADACSPAKPNILAPGEKMDFQIHVNPGSIEGCTPYDITFTDYEDPTIILGHATGEVCISSTVSTKNNPSQSNLSVFPNPTSDYFQVSETPGLKYIELFNIVGNKVRSYDALPQKQYAVNDLTDGIYLVRLMTSTGKIIKTIRLSKR